MKKTIAVLAIATLGFAACGDDDDPADTTLGSEGTTAGSDLGETLDGFKDQLVDLGMSEEQADCVIDESVELGMSGETAPDMSAMQDIFATCDVDMGDLAPSS